MREAGGGWRRLSLPRSPLPVHPSRFSPRPGGCWGEREGGGRTGQGGLFSLAEASRGSVGPAAESVARARLREGSGGGGGCSGQGRGTVGKVAFKTAAKRRQKVFVYKLIASKPRVVPILGESVMVSPVPCASRVSQPVGARTELPVISLVICCLLSCKM